MVDPGLRRDDGLGATADSLRILASWPAGVMVRGALAASVV